LKRKASKSGSYLKLYEVEELVEEEEEEKDVEQYAVVELYKV